MDQLSSERGRDMHDLPRTIFERISAPLREEISRRPRDQDVIERVRKEILSTAGLVAGEADDS